MSDSSSELASLRALVSGRVHGVYFRDFVRSHARSLGLTGWVRNVHRPPVVEVVVEGERGKLEELIRQLHRGPPAARVEAVDVEWGEYSGRHSDFSVRF